MILVACKVIACNACIRKRAKRRGLIGREGAPTETGTERDRPNEWYTSY